MLRKVLIKIVTRVIYTYLPIYFLYIHSPVLLQNKKFLCRPLQIACTATTINVTCTQATVRVHRNSWYWFLYVKIIWICQFLHHFFFFFFFFFFLPSAWMILSCITSCEGHKLWKLSTVHWCYQPVMIENYFSPAHTDH